jgi:hypothetical protein
MSRSLPKDKSVKLELNPSYSLASPTGDNRVMSTIESIVRELEKNPEPMQRSVLEFVVLAIDTFRTELFELLDR